MKRFLTILIIIIVIGGGLFAFGSYRAQQARAETLANLQTEVAQTGSLTATVGATGVVRSNQSATLTWQTSGTVESVTVQAGDAVTADQVLASIKQTTLPQGVILAQADLVSAQQALNDLYDTDLQLAQALQAVEDAQQELDDLSHPETKIAEAGQALVDAQEALKDAQDDRTKLNYARTDDLTIEDAYTDYLLAKDDYKEALKAFNKVDHKALTHPARVLALENLVAAEDKMDTAFANYNWLLLPATEADIAEADAALALAQANLADAQADYDKLLAGPTEAEIALAEANLTNAQKNYEDLKDGPDPDDIAVAEARVAAAQATLTQIAIAAPFDGVISEVMVKPGDLVSPGSSAFQLDDLSHLLVDVEVSEVDINRIKVGQDALLTFDAILAKAYHGQVADVALVGSTSAGVVSFKVTVELRDADENVRSGMTAGVNIVVSELENVLLVPNRAVRVLNGNRVVYVLDDTSPAPVPVVVELGVSSETYSEVVGGELNLGDEIVLNPPTDFSSFFGGGPPGQ